MSTEPKKQLNEVQVALLESLGLRPPTWGQILFRMGVRLLGYVVVGAFLGLGLKLVGIG